MIRVPPTSCDDSGPCDCTAESTGPRLVVDATDCPENGRLADSPGCRVAVVTALAECDAVAVWAHTTRAAWRYTDGASALLIAAGRFATLVSAHDDALAARARRDPLEAARVATGCPDPIARIAAETGLAAGAHHVSGYDDAFAVHDSTFTAHGSTFVSHAESARRDRAIEATTGITTDRRRNATHVCGWLLEGSMLHDVENAGELTPEELRARYDERLRAPIHDAGIEAVAAESGVDEETIAALDTGESPDITVASAASILATREDAPDADAIETELRDHLLLGMTTAVLDVEAIESGIDGELDAREIQQKIEGRLAMSLDELAVIHGYIEERRP